MPSPIRSVYGWGRLFACFCQAFVGASDAIGLDTIRPAMLFGFDDEENGALLGAQVRIRLTNCQVSMAVLQIVN